MRRAEITPKVPLNRAVRGGAAEQEMPVPGQPGDAGVLRGAGAVAEGRGRPQQRWQTTACRPVFVACRLGRFSPF